MDLRSRAFITLLAAALLPIGGCDRGAPTDAAVDAGGVAAPPIWFEECAAERGIVFRHDSGHRSRFLLPECVSGGCALFDADNDGDLDAYLVQSGDVLASADDRPANRLFRNRGDGHFDDVTEGSGADDRGYGMGVAAGDYDNDGWIDLYVTNYGPNVLLRNLGNGTFDDVTDRAGVGHPGLSASAAFVDYDADGDLDLFVTNYVNWSPEAEIDCTSDGGEADYCSPKNYDAPSVDALYRNNGDGAFTDVSLEAGLTSAFGNGLGVVCDDFNLDGRIDIFVANDGTPNQLWENQGDGTFINVADARGCAKDLHGDAKAGMGVDVVDQDDDGDADLLVVNLATESDSFYRNEGAFFLDDTARVGLAAVSRARTRFGMAFVDFDLDGWVDLFQANGRVMKHSKRWSDDPYAEPNMLLRGSASGRFTEVSPMGGTREPIIFTSRGAAFGDIDNDGDVDVLIANRDAPPSLLLNVAPRAGNWITMRIVDEHGRDALGALVELRIGERTIKRRVISAYSYLAANDPRIHVGLGDADSVTNVQVTWPTGEEERFGSLPAGRIAILRKGKGPP